MRQNITTFAIISLFLSPLASAQDTILLWGDTHVHSSYSVDAYSNGNLTADPDTAFRYAKGQPVLHPATGQRIRIDRPLDFLVVADHAEMLQLQFRLDQRDPGWLNKPTAERLVAAQETNIRAVFGEVVQIGSGGGEELLRDYHTPDLRQIAWQSQTAIIDSHNEPGKFTALIGWEWSSAPDNANLHRVIFTPDNADVANQFIPLSYYDTMQPEGLWQWLDETSARTGADFVAIPHNANMSDGMMYDMVDSNGLALTTAYARTRMRWEPVMEITQVKGTSETMAELSPDDPFAGFEVRNKLLIGEPSAISEGSYARGALKRGLVLEQQTGINPFQFGVIGSTDSHTGLSSVDEGNYYGKMVGDSLPSQRVNPAGGFPAWETSASGLAAVWATENTRGAITDAFKRREVYATSGPRIMVRFFGGFRFETTDTTDLLTAGYARGVPMGGELSAAPVDTSPGFLIAVSKDPMGANLDRVQIVKGWLDAAGNTHEKVFDVAWNDNRQPDANGMLPALPTTVNISTATYTNSVGSTQLEVLWHDPEFNPDDPVFYYVRALEIETPRHQVYDAVALGINPADTNMPLTLQERAWSSPIWYTP